MEKSDRIITANLMGGIGNQLFQIAAAYALSKELKRNLKFQKNQFSGCRQGTHPSRYYNNIFQKLDFVDNLTIESTINEHKWTYSSLTDDISEKIRSVCINGYFQSDLYFKKYSKEVKYLFTPNDGIISYLEKNSNVFDNFPELKEDNDYAFIGIRRGDYLTYSNIHNPCGMTYFNKAISLMPKNRYYISTDDIEWARSKFVGDQYRFFDIKDDLIQLLTIALFKNYIISNSSFHWWGSFLSIYDNPRIIAPDKWIFGPEVKKEEYWSIYRDSMEVIERPIETN